MHAPFDKVTDRDISVFENLASVFARLAFLSGQRDSNTARYSPEELLNAELCSAHEAAFAEWLGYSLEQKRADLELYLSGLDCSEAQVIETWRRLRPYRLFVPLSAMPAEERLFLCDLETLLEVISNESGFRLAWNAVADWRVNAVLETIENRSGDVRLTLKAISVGKRISGHRLGLLFKAATGRSFRKYLQDVRMRHALRLLRDPSLSVTEVSSALGYSKPSNFVQEFRHYCGVTPGECRDRQLVGDSSRSAVTLCFIRSAAPQSGSAAQP
jgi:AraC-like DNA-binding protein